MGNTPKKTIEEFCNEVKHKFDYMGGAYDKSDFVGDLTRFLEAHQGDEGSGYAYNCLECGTPLSYSDRGIPTYSCESCQKTWPACNIADFAVPSTGATVQNETTSKRETFAAGDRVRVEKPIANPFWHWRGIVKDAHVLDGQPFYRISAVSAAAGSPVLLLLFHETWLSKI